MADRLSPLVITACSNRKRVQPPVQGLARALPSGALEEVAKAWAKNLKGITPTQSADRLYCGRGFGEAVEARALVQGRMVILSAGLGLVRANADIPAYNMTVTSGSLDNVLLKLQGPFVSPSDWLGRVRDHLPQGMSLSLSKVAQGAPIVFCALSRSYMEMISAEFKALSSKTQNKFRFFGLGTQSCLPSHLQRLWMPYDDRLDGRRSKAKGTRSDFAQRAMHDFVANIYPSAKTKSADVHSRMVAERLKGWHRAPKFDRQKCSDPEIKALIKKHWATVGGRSTMMLRLFRDDLQIACEQRRFQDLFKQVAAAKGH